MAGNFQAIFVVGSKAENGCFFSGEGYIFVDSIYEISSFLCKESSLLVITSDASVTMSEINRALYPLSVYFYHLSLLSIEDIKSTGAEKACRDCNELVVKEWGCKYLKKRINEVSQSKICNREANIRNSRFIASLAHDMKTPLHGILSVANIGKMKYKKASAEKLLEYFTVIENSAVRLQQFFDDIFDLTKLDYNGLDLDFEQVDLVSLIEEVVDISRARVKKEVDFISGCDFSGEKIYCDKKRLIKALSNIAGSMERFIEGVGNIDIGVSVCDNNQVVEIKFACFGNDEVAREMLFESQRFDSKIAEKNRGLGYSLDLSVAKAVVVAHGGSLRVDSEKDLVVLLVMLPVDKRQSY